MLGSEQFCVLSHRELPPAGYSRRSPLYSGGKHTTTYAVQPMEPLLPDPNKVGMGKVGMQTADTEAGRVMLSVWGRICLRRSRVERLAWGC